MKVSFNGSPVAGSFSFQNNDTRIVFTPSVPFVYGVTTVTTTPGLTDVAGNTVSNTVAFSFAVDLPSDSTRPSVIYYNPLHNTVGVGRNVTLQVKFNERLNPITVNTASFYLVDNNTTLLVPGTVTTSLDRLGATFTPSALLSASSTYCWHVNEAATDLAGNQLNHFAVCFSTGVTADTSAPTITAISPPNGTVAVPLNSVILAQSNEPINPVSFQNDARTVTLPLNAGETNPLDLGLFPPGAKITLASGGHGYLANPALQTLPDGALFVPATSPFLFANSGASGYSTLNGGDGVNHFLGGGANYSSGYSFAGKQTTDTTDVAAIRLGAVVGTFTPTPSRADWFPIGAGTTVTVPAGAIGSHLYLAVNDIYNPDNFGSYQVNYVAAVSGTLALTATFTVSAGGIPIPGLPSLSADGLALSFSPSVQLQASTPHTVQITGVTDYAGNLMTPFTSTFTTAAAVDITAPTIVSVTPAYAVTDVSTNSPVTIRYSKFINPLTVNSNTFFVFQDGTNIHIPGTLAVDNSGTLAPGAIITFTPSPLFPSGSKLFIEANNFQDFVGNSPPEVFQPFTTAGTPDTTPPVVLSVTPTDGSQDMGLNTVVSLTFSKPLNPQTVNGTTFVLFSGTTRINFINLGTSIDLRTVNMTIGLPANALITVIATKGVTDLAGNPLADFRSTFTTVKIPDSNRPSVVGMRPGGGTSQVPVNFNVVLFVNKPLLPSTVPGAVHVSQNGVIVNGTVTLQSNNQAVQFTPAAPFLPNAYVQVFFDSTATDAFGNALNNFQAQFSTAADLTAANPTITATVPGNAGNLTVRNPAIQVQFSTPLDASTVNSTNFTLKLNNQIVPATASLTTPATVKIVPASPLLPGTAYSYQVTAAVKDTNGLPLANAASYSFVTGATPDTAQPRVSALTPPDTTSNVGTNAPIEVRFNKPLNPLTISTTTIQVTAGGNAIAPMSINLLNNSTQDVVLTPITVLPDGATINIAVNGVEDLAGNTVVPVNASFQTRTGVDLVNANVVRVDPFNEAQNIPTNTVITLQFDKPMDPVTIDSSSFYVRDLYTGQPIPGTYSTSPSGTTATFVPASLLAVGRQYAVTWTGSAHDLAGNFLNGSTTSFVAALTPPNVTPAVTMSSPENGQTGAPINSTLQVQFNEPVRAVSLQDVTLSANGSVVSGVVKSLSAGNTLLTITPPTLLQSSTPYTINIAGVQDFGGNALTPSVTRSFTTASGADLIYPSVVTVNPPTGFVGAGTNINPAIVFSKRMNPVSLNESTVLMYNQNNGLYVKMAVTPSADRTSVTLSPATPLLPGTRYVYTLSGPADLVGNGVGGSWNFTTGDGPDQTAPVITLMNPANGSTTSVNVRLHFYTNKPINPLSFNPSTAVVLTTGATGIGGAATLGADLQTITFQPAANLSAGANFTVALSGFKDLAGNTVTPFFGTFSTNNTGVPDTTVPSVLSTTPANFATQVPVNTPIVITFSEPIDPITVDQNNIAIFLYSPQVRMAGTFAVNGPAVTFTPATQIPPNTLIQITVKNIQDIVGNTMATFFFSFTTADTVDTTPPSVLSVTPVNNATNQGQNTPVVITFSKSISGATINTDNFALFAGSTRLNIGIAASSDWRMVTLTAFPLPANTLIHVTVSHDVKDIAGNPLPDFVSFLHHGSGCGCQPSFGDGAAPRQRRHFRAGNVTRDPVNQ